MGLKEWAIRFLGGHTAEEYCTKAAELEAAKQAHDATFKWVNGSSILRADLRGSQYKARMVTELDDHAPVEILKARIADQLASRLLNDGLVSFDICDDSDSMGMPRRLYTGEVTVVVPECYGSNCIR